MLLLSGERKYIFCDASHDDHHVGVSLYCKYCLEKDDHKYEDALTKNRKQYFIRATGCPVILVRSAVITCKRRPGKKYGIFSVYRYTNVHGVN